MTDWDAEARGIISTYEDAALRSNVAGWSMDRSMREERGWLVEQIAALARRAEREALERARQIVRGMIGTIHTPWHPDDVLRQADVLLRRETEGAGGDTDCCLLEADAAFQRADERALKALRRALTPGRVVSWKHGDRVRAAEVVAVNGFAYYTTHVRVQSLTSFKRYDVPASSIVAALGIVGAKNPPAEAQG